MLKIEIVKFEAQDIITASGVASEPTIPCVCRTNCYGGNHFYWDETVGYDRCKATEHTNCPNP